MDIKKIIYWVSTALMCGLFAFSAQMYFRNTEMVIGFFEGMNFPSWVVIPLAIAKVFGIIAILSNKSKVLSEWAYAGFFFDVILATAAHHFVGHDPFGMSFFGIIFVLVSRFTWSYR